MPTYSPKLYSSVGPAAGSRSAEYPQRSTFDTLRRRPLLLLLALSLILLLGLYSHPTHQDGLLRVFNNNNKEEWSTDGCLEAITHQGEVLESTFRQMFRDARRVALIGIPDHSNKGDSAIAVGERALLQSLGIDIIYDCISFAASEPVPYQKLYNKTELQDALRGEDKVVIAFHGGGNLGDLYWPEIELRLGIVRDFPHLPIVSFPQSIHFEHQNNADSVANIFGSHPDLQLALRDKASYAFALQHFAPLGTKVFYTPDIAFAIGQRHDLRQRFKPQHDLLLFQRTDLEATNWLNDSLLDGVKVRKEVEGRSIMASVDSIVGDWIWTDISADRKLDSSLAQISHFRMEQGAEFLSMNGRFAIIDRLHGHIISVLLGIPHVLVDNNIGKLTDYYSSWTNTCNLARLAKSPSDAADTAAHFFRNEQRYTTLPWKIPALR